MSVLNEALEWCKSKGIDASEHEDLLNGLEAVYTNHGYVEPTKEKLAEVKDTISWRVGLCA